MSSSMGIMSEVESRSRRGTIIRVVLGIMLALFSCGLLFPFIFTFTAGLKTSSEIYQPGLNLWPDVAHWENYREAWTRFNMPRMFLNTFAVTLGGVVGQLTVCSMAAYSLSRLKPIGQKVIMTMLFVSMAIPAIAYIIPLYTTLVKLPLLNISLLNSYWGLWLPYAANAFTIIVLKNFFEQIPQDIYDAAMVDGASSIRIFWSITLPLARPILLTLAVLTFISLWKDFLLPLLVLRDAKLQPVTVRLFALVKDFPKNLQMAASFTAMVPPLIAALLLQRFIKGGLTIGGSKG